MIKDGRGSRSAKDRKSKKETPLPPTAWLRDPFTGESIGRAAVRKLPGRVLIEIEPTDAKRLDELLAGAQAISVFGIR